ncbi:hypothetical protein HPB51_011247 [Rhipicephalus microplus]|uniref:Endonuclease/exonuclease/phosphatase domain-containing protein n=1 Tax=Rhipicephalus microplus TaxID=6941 RepID=A0A9J6DLP4_RHIMP|nr:hypothetical protein HPB51_011247 [Rhipicephalus microplus]
MKASTKKRSVDVSRANRGPRSPTPKACLPRTLKAHPPPRIMAINRRIANENLTIWSWNCRSLHNKHATLTLYINAALVPPDVICLQEVGARPKTVSGYKLYMDPNTPKIATLVRKELAATCITAPNEETQHLIVTLWPAKKGRPKQVICNIYSPPQDRKAEFSNIFHYLNNKLQPRDRLIITGDFNAWHTTWGYSADRPKGTRLLEAIQRYDYTLPTTPGIPTRIGNSVNRDTNPDLTVTNNATTMRWSVLDDNLGSDHNIVQITYETARRRRLLGKARLTNWTKYREQQEVDGPKPTTIAQWTSYIKGLYDKNTKIYQTTTDAPAIDTHLTHLWEARRGLTKRWRRQKLNKKLRLRIAKITEEVNAYSKELYNNWRTFCDSLKGTLSMKKTWYILRSLLDPSATRTETNATLQRLAGEFQGVCPWCSNHTATLTHITYQCTERPANAVSRLVRSLQTLTTWSWEARLSELALGSQLVTLDQARRAAVASGALQEGSTRD